MKKIKLILLLILSIILVGCAKSDIEVFRFANHEIELKVGEEAILSLIYGEYSEDSEVKYTLSEEGIISLNGNIVTGLQVGKATVHATIDGIKYANVVVKVVQEQISLIKINSEGNFFQQEGSMQLSVSVFPENLSHDVIWSIEDSQWGNANAAEIDEEGLLIVNDATTPTKLIVVAQSKFDPNMRCKKAFYIKYRPTETIIISTVNNITQVSADGTLELKISAYPESSTENIKIESSKPSLLWLDESNKLKAAKKDDIQKTEIVIITCTSWDGVKSSIRIMVKK
ncbi:MAG: hypothetical protein M0R05_00125 [Bacilli bacterium]|nr:hypothetical protein [Bacilli bacterium]MDD4076609.1 hypothetical protein [Bacilli bacterium]MDD4387929.1 hypothetical protein [Bacilli bacterium]